ncbi:MAG TPA: aromatic ring-hydroxylating dioxygenase subunit alpha [Sphingomonas sp.]|nr:aromatic ring-hydroxylating dioxygenase subunit alpha [Sphingomonas sp.]
MSLVADHVLVDRILDHVDRGTTDCRAAIWREPVEHYLDPARLAAELESVLRRDFVVFCPAAALASPGAYVARDAALIPIVAVRGQDGVVRAFRNACRHRGVQLADGSGCARALVCRYHGWTYALDGRLQAIPDSYGFPGVAKEEHGLVPVETIERFGLIFVRQNGDAALDPALEALAGIIGPEWRLASSSSRAVDANWKIIAEGFLEGYHIRSTHNATFYPVQYHNLNVIETFGRNNRITFPYRKIEQQRDREGAERSPRGAATKVYHLFPNVMVATFPTNINISILEPLAPDRTMLVDYLLTDQPADEAGNSLVKVGQDFVARGFAEDVEMTTASQRGLRAQASTHFTFGLYEAAIGNLHRELAARLG